MFGDGIERCDEKTLLDDKFIIFLNYHWLNN